MKVRVKGFTLVELIITVALAAIVLTIGVPSFQDTTRNNRLATQANEFIGALHIVRSEAIKRRTRVTLCKSSTGTNCTTDNGYEQGWIIFSDPENTGIFNSGEELIRVSGKLSGNNTLRAGGTYTHFISYLPSGISQGSGGLPNDTFRLCDDRGTTEARSIIISSTGRIRTQKGVTTCP